jgi:hypothetical protein
VKASPRGSASSMRNSTPFGHDTISIVTISSELATTPSDRLNPIAKSSRSAGVAIITAWVTRS